MELKKGMLCKHFKGTNLIEKNIYEILAVNPIYTGTKEDVSPVVVYSSIFQDGKTFVRESADLLEELSSEEKEIYGQNYRIEPLTEEELEIIKTEEFINAKKEYLAMKYGNEEIKKHI